MSDYDDYREDEERFFRDLEDLAETRKADKWEQRLRELAARVDMSRQSFLKTRARFIQNMMKARPEMSEENAAALFDRAFGLEPPN